MADDIETLAARRLCADCIGEDFLSREVRVQGTPAACDYCEPEEEAPTFSIEEMADRVEGVMEEHFKRTPEEPSGFEYTMQKYGEHDWERDGDPTAIVIMNLADIPEDAANDIQQLLADRHYDSDRRKAGEELEYSDQTHYAETGADTWDLRESWTTFERSVQTEARYFNPIAESVLSDLFAAVHDLRTHDGKPVVRTIGPGTRRRRLVRARVFQSTERLKEALANPERFIGTPATRFAASGRMNARGVPAFYGATAPSVAIAEVRPPVGSRVVTAEFQILRPLKVLDVAALETIFVRGSLFDPAFASNFNRAAFLRALSRRIVMPVMPDDAETDYLVTQVMAEFLAHRLEPGLDGILYPSAQGARGAANVVLFNPAARVAPAPLAAGDKVEVETSMSTEEGPEPHYVVWREPAPPPAPREAAARFDLHLLNARPHSPTDEDFDYRADTLQLDRATLKVRHIQSVRVRDDAHSVDFYDWSPRSVGGEGLEMEPDLDF